MNDAALDRDLDAALNVEPSPEFVARVRTRMAAEPLPSRWGMHWPLAAAAASLAAVALVLAAAVLQRGGEVAPTDAARSVPSSSATPSGAAEDHRAATADARPVSPERSLTPVPEATVVRHVEADAPPRQTSSSQAMAERRPFPEVVISEEEKRAFTLLLTSIDQERLPPLPEQTVTDARALEPMPLDIMPLVIEPLTPLARLE